MEKASRVKKELEKYSVEELELMRTEVSANEEGHKQVALVVLFIGSGVAIINFVVGDLGINPVLFLFLILAISGVAMFMQNTALKNAVIRRGVIDILIKELKEKDEKSAIDQENELPRADDQK